MDFKRIYCINRNLDFITDGRRGMNRTMLSSSGFLAILITSLLFSAPAFAKKYDDHGKHKKHHDKYEQHDGRGDDRGDTNVNVNVHFGDRERVVVHDYYEDRHHKGHCPPGLRKKQNGCMPPGQAKKWHKGRPLPRDVVYHDLPPRVVVQIGLPPAGHKYVRVAADILLIAVGTGIVVDAIEDLGRI
jgi:Ni/Co efflux regulator RcnB